MTHFRLRPISLALLLLLVCAFSAAPVTSTTTFQFVGTCTDCTGQGTAQLVLQNYTQGSALASSNFVGFSYSSNLVSFTLTAANNPVLSGTLPASLPAAANVNIWANTTANGVNAGMELYTQTSGGSWCAGFECAGDYGTAGTWSLVTTTTTTPAAGAPALSDWMLVCLAAAIAAMGALLLKKACRTRFQA